MTIATLDHFTIRTSHFDETLTFFRNVIELADGWRPGFKFPGAWLYAADKPVLHIVALSERNDELHSYLGEKKTQAGSGCVDHIAFRCAGLKETQMRLLRLGQHFRERIVPAAGEHQLFLEDPNGITIELIFPHALENHVAGEEMPRLPTADEE